MHIFNKQNFTKDILFDHTLIINEIDQSIKFYNWHFILSLLPKGSFLVGGYIRDLILGRLNKKIDVDIVVPNNAINIGHEISNNCKGRFIILDKKREVVRIIFKHISIDIASQIGYSIEDDLCRRDFSINSIAFSFDEKLLIDPLNGLKDLELSLIRTKSNQNILDDPLRILRCFRLVSELNFNIDENLKNFIISNKDKLNLVSKERIVYELQKIIRGEKSVNSIYLINKFKIFNYIERSDNSNHINFRKINYQDFNQFEREKFLPLFNLIQILDDFSLKKLKFSKFEVSNAKILRKWESKIKQKSINDLDEIERYELHKELEHILPSFILFLPKSFHSEWLKRWRDKDDKLFHPSNPLTGELIKKHLKIEDGPLLGSLISYLSRELAFNRLRDFDEAIYKAKQWFKQNAPKCD